MPSERIATNRIRSRGAIIGAFNGVSLNRRETVPPPTDIGIVVMFLPDITPISGRA